VVAVLPGFIALADPRAHRAAPRLFLHRTQEGLPVAHHERTFTAEGDGFTFNLSVAYEARRGLRGVVDRVVLKQAVRRLLQQTLDALEVAFASGERTTERSGAG